MTQTGDPLHNAIAKRINNTLKNSGYICCDDQTFGEATRAVSHAITIYNTARPNQGLAGRTPLQALDPDAPNPLLSAQEEGKEGTSFDQSNSDSYGKGKSIESTKPIGDIEAPPPAKDKRKSKGKSNYEGKGKSKPKSQAKSECDAPADTPWIVSPRLYAKMNAQQRAIFALCQRRLSLRPSTDNPIPG